MAVALCNVFHPAAEARPYIPSLSLVKRHDPIGSHIPKVVLNEQDAQVHQVEIHQIHQRTKVVTEQGQQNVQQVVTEHVQQKVQQKVAKDIQNIAQLSEGEQAQPHVQQKRQQQAQGDVQQLIHAGERSVPAVSEAQSNPKVVKAGGIKGPDGSSSVPAESTLANTIAQPSASASIANDAAVQQHPTEDLELKRQHEADEAKKQQDAAEADRLRKQQELEEAKRVQESQEAERKQQEAAIQAAELERQRDLELQRQQEEEERKLKETRELDLKRQQEEEERKLKETQELDLKRQQEDPKRAEVERVEQEQDIAAVASSEPAEQDVQDATIVSFATHPANASAFVDPNSDNTAPSDAASTENGQSVPLVGPQSDLPELTKSQSNEEHNAAHNEFKDPPTIMDMLNAHNPSDPQQEQTQHKEAEKEKQKEDTRSLLDSLQDSNRIDTHAETKQKEEEKHVDSVLETLFKVRNESNSHNERDLDNMSNNDSSNNSNSDSTSSSAGSDSPTSDSSPSNSQSSGGHSRIQARAAQQKLEQQEQERQQSITLLVVLGSCGCLVVILTLLAFLYYRKCITQVYKNPVEKNIVRV
jgi:hypothetical protein